MSDIQTVDNTPSPNKVPTAEQFAAAVKDQLAEWGQSNVEGLCYSQTQVVIEDLTPYYYEIAGDNTIPTVETFKEVIQNFQQQKERLTFNELTEPELTELAAALAPHFHTSAENTQG